MADNLPIDVDLFRNSIREAKFGGARFEVVSYSVRTGTKITTTNFTKSTATAGASAGRTAATRRGTATDTGNLIAEGTVQLKEATIDGSSTALSTSLYNPKVDTTTAYPYKVMLRAYFLDTTAASITAFVAGDSPIAGRESYQVQRDTFLKKVNDPTPKLLQLPTYNGFMAVAGEVKTSYDNMRGGIEYVDVEFYRATEDIKSEKIKTSALVVVAANYNNEITTIAGPKAQNATQQALQNASGTLPTRVTVAMEADNVSRLASMVNTVSGLASSVISSIDSKIATIDKFTREVASIANQINTLILAPAELAEHILGTYETLTGAITSPIEAYSYMRNRLNIVLDEFVDTTYDTLDTLGIYSASVAMTHASYSFSYMTQGAVETTYDSVEDILTVRDEMQETYNALVEFASKFPEFEDPLRSIQSLYGTTLEFLMEQQALLPNIRNITVRENTPLIVTAHRLYGDARFVDILASRNKVQSSIFPPTELEVLSE